MIGNAVPVNLAFVMATKIKELLENQNSNDKEEIIQLELVL